MGKRRNVKFRSHTGAKKKVQQKKTKPDTVTMGTGACVHLDSAPSEWYSMEIKTVVVTAKGREIHISRLNNVLSFRCICPKCEERFTDEASLKVHCREKDVAQTYGADKNVETISSRPTLAVSSCMVEGGNHDNGTERSNRDPIEFTGVADGSPYNVDMSSKKFSLDDQNNTTLWDNDNSSSETDIGTVEDENDISEVDNGTIDADKGTCTDNFNETGSIFKQDTNCVSKIDERITDLDYTVDTTAKKPFKCTECGKAYKRKKGLLIHRRIHKGYVFKCHKCDKQLSSEASLKAHSKLHSGDRPYLCKICDLGFLKKYLLDEHSRKHRIESLISQYKRSQEPSTDSTQTLPVGKKANAMFDCEICGLKIIGWQKYIEHQHVHTGAKPYVCAICGEAYRVKSKLNTHYRLHLGEDEFKCHECGRHFLSPGSLNAHRKAHSGERPFQCTLCPKAFTKRDHLNMHMKRHTRDFAHNCHDCGKLFATAWHLKSHRWSHTGEKPFLCPTCGKGFAGHTRFKEHKMIHTGEKPHVCKVCGKGFNQKHCLKDHLTIHEDNAGLLCSFCGKSCRHRSALNAHVRTVHRESPDEKLNIESYFTI